VGVSLLNEKNLSEGASSERLMKKLGPCENVSQTVVSVSSFLPSSSLP
jgi:hypothetical protein